MLHAALVRNAMQDPVLRIQILKDLAVWAHVLTAQAAAVSTGLLKQTMKVAQLVRNAMEMELVLEQQKMRMLAVQASVRNALMEPVSIELLMISVKAAAVCARTALMESVPQLVRTMLR